VSKGAIGYIVEVYKDAYEVEFSDEQGTTVAIFAAKAEDVELAE
jgi:hypothetical protein